MLTRCEWMGNRDGQAAVEFEAAITANHDPKQDAYLRQCLDAVKCEIRRSADVA